MADSTMQHEVSASGMLDGTLVLQSPTGSGKTWLSRRAVTQTVAKRRRAVYLAPLRALARELYVSWKAAMPDISIGVHTGEVGIDDLEDNPTAAEAQVLILTPEKLDLYLRTYMDHLDWMADVDLLVVDELHTLASDKRGAVLEGVITRFKGINPFFHVLALSATLGNPDELATWLGGKAHVSTERPVPLTWRIRTHKNDSKADVVSEEVAVTAGAGRQCIVFCQSRPRVESLTKRLAEDGYRVAAHHAGLSKEARLSAELDYRAGRLDCLCATGTLAMGLNMGARAVIVHDLQRWNAGGWQDLLVSEVWQLGGRAGRRGIDETGEVVLLAPAWNQKHARKVIGGKFEPIRSSLAQSAKAFAEQVLVVFGSGMALTQQQCVRVLSKSLMSSEIGVERLDMRVDAAVKSMLEAEMLQRSEEGYLRATRLGRIAVRFQLSPGTVLSWAALDEALSGATLFDLLVAICASEDFTARVRVEQGEVSLLQDLVDAEPMQMRGLKEYAWKRFCSVRGKDFSAAAKTALALRRWTRLGDEAAAAESIGVMPHEIEEARKEAVRMLQAMAAIFESRRKLVEVGAQSDLDVTNPDKARALSAMVCAGLDDEQATLALISGVGPVMARRLATAGVNDIEELALADIDAVAAVPGISEKRARKWIDAAGDYVRDGGALRYKELCRAGGNSAANEKLMFHGVDHSRWLRAQSLEVAQSSEAAWVVSGGNEPHTVSRIGSVYRCDCKDRTRGNVCKHEIAVRHLIRDSEVPRFDELFVADSGSFSLIGQWNTSRMGVASSWK